MTTLPFTTSRPCPRPSVVTRVLSRPAVVLVVIVVTSMALRLMTVVRHTSPRTFPDEYIYAVLARSLASGDGFSIRGEAAHFPAILQPLLTAPFWALGDAVTAYRLTQFLNVVAVSLAALPIYWLTRRIGAPAWQALCCAALAVALPTLVFSSYVMADAIAYPLVLGAVCAGVAALDRPTHWNQALFVLLAGLSVLARVQYVVVTAAFAVAALVIARGNPFLAARRHSVVAVLVGVPGLALVALGPGRVLGYYDGVLGLQVSTARLVHWACVDAMLLAYVIGVTVVPGAIAGFVTGFRRDAAGPHRALVAMITPLFALVLLETALYAASGSERFQERYLVALAPLLPVAFCAGARVLPAGKWLSVAVAGVLLFLSMFVPLSGYTALDGKKDSAFLMAVGWVEQHFGVGNTGLAIALIAAFFACVAAVAALGPRIGVPLALGLAVVAVALASMGATAYDAQAAKRMEATFSEGGSWTWVDDSGLGPTSVLVTPGADRATAEVQMFWNRNLGRVLRMPTAPEVDVFGDTLATIAADGELMAGGIPVRGPLLVEESISPILLDNARLVRRTVSATLWQPRGVVHVAMLTVGRYVDGWLDPKTRITVWPRQDGARTGIVVLRLSLPVGLAPAIVQLKAPGISRTVRIAPGDTVAVRVPVSARTGPFRIDLEGNTAILDGQRAVVARMERPQLLEQGR